MSPFDTLRTNLRVPPSHLGAREITCFDGTLANDNEDAGQRLRGPRRYGLGLPAVAFVSGLSAATVAAVLEQLLRLGL